MEEQIMPTISKRLRDFLGISDDTSDKEIEKSLKKRLSTICKPCWELKYCPYGPLVEDFPLPPITRKEHQEHINYLKECIRTGYMGQGDNKTPLDDERRKWFEDEINNDNLDKYVEEVSTFEKEASCTEFGHLCPAFFVSEPFTETEDGRKRGRNLPHATIIRVARRDNNTCQICGKILLDREIEIDHIIPYSKGGSSEEHNLRVACMKCNRSKGSTINFRKQSV